MAYSLRDGIFFCIASETVVLLNLKTNAYQIMGSASGDAFRHLIDGSLMPSDIATLERLVTKGIMDRSDGTYAVPTPPSISIAKTSLLPGHRTVNTGHLLFQATSAQIITALKLRTSPLPRIIDDVKHRKQSAAARVLVFNHDTQRRVAAAMLQSQYFVPSAQKCLRRSLALVDLLARHDQFPDLVFGVRVRPFNAHAWVQHEDAVLNDSLDEVLRYTPIMVI